MATPPERHAWDAPALGEEDYLGRRQSVVSVVRLLRAGRHVSILGGAKIGKTSLLGAVALALGSGVSRVRFVDDAGALATPAGRPRLDEIAALAAGRGADHDVTLCFAGTRRWRDAMLHPGCPLAARGILLKSFPLSAWDRRAAAALIRSAAPEATSAPIGRLIHLSGYHPYLLKGLLSRWPDLDASMEACRAVFETTFAAWSGEMAPPEGAREGLAAVDARPLMRYLVERESPVSFDHARRTLKREDLKAEADLLCLLGVLGRKLHGEEATAVLHAECGLFNDWYRSNQPPT